MTIAVDLGRKATKQTNKQNSKCLNNGYKKKYWHFLYFKKHMLSVLIGSDLLTETLPMSTTSDDFIKYHSGDMDYFFIFKGDNFKISNSLF